MIVYYLDDDLVIREFDLGDVVIQNQETFNKEMDEKFPNGWSDSKYDFMPDIDEYPEDEYDR